MTKFLLSFIILISLSACSQETPVQIMEKYLWEKRVVILFTPSSSHDVYIKQKQAFEKSKDGLKERDLIIWEAVYGEYVLADKAALPHISALNVFKEYDVKKDEFAFVLIGKDGGEKLRKNGVVSSEDLFKLIDSMPMRQQEMLQQ